MSQMKDYAVRRRTASLSEIDPEIFDSINAEIKRQENNLELIASENIASKAVLDALGSPLTDKYAEGYPAKRYYGGCEHVDVTESLAIERAKKLFGADHANVQPHSGAQANMAVYFTVLKPGDTYMAMNLAHGGHLTHGSPVNFSGKMYNVVPYGVRQDNELIDYDELRDLAKKHRPRLIVAGATVYPRGIDYKTIREICDEVEALMMVDMAHPAGLIAAGEYPTPVPHAHFVTSTTHKTLRGPRGGMVLCKEEFAKDIDKTIFPGLQGGPLMHCIAGKAVCYKEAMQPEFKQYQKQVKLNAQTLAGALSELGYRMVSGGTDSHLMLIDLSSTGVTGKEAQIALDTVNITVNRNMIPFDTQKPFVTSGIRIGTPAVTSRGMEINEMRTIASLIDQALKSIGNDAEMLKVKNGVLELCGQYPVRG